MNLYLSILFGVVIFLLPFIHMYFSDNTNHTIIILFVGAGFFMLGATVIPVSSDTSTETLDLQALGTGTSVSGQAAFLGSGSIDSEPSYRYYVETEDEDGETYSDLREALTSDSKVYQNAEEGATVEITEKKTTHIFNFYDDVSSTYKFRVPEGSVVESTTLDLGK